MKLTILGENWTAPRPKTFASRRRSGLHVLVDILHESRAGATKTRLINRANLNSRLIEKYLTFLLEKGLIARITVLSSTRHRDIYQVTALGHRLLEDFHELDRLLKG